jgi:general secretion pathway protein N
MRRPAVLIALGALLCLFFLVALWPARVAIGWLVPSGASLAGVSGTVWQGSAARVRIGVMDVGALTWDARPLTFLLGSPTWRLEATRPDGFARAMVKVKGTRGVAVSDLELGTTLDAVSSWVELAGTRGNVSARVEALALEAGLLSALAGRVVVDSLRPMGLRDVDLGAMQIDIPSGQSGPFVGAVTALSGPLRIEQGRVEVQPDGNFIVDGLVAAQPDAPREIVQGLEFLGQADAQGFRRFRHQGRL